MLYHVSGRSGSGKTKYILERLGEAIKAKKRCFLIVPEQQSLVYEALLCDNFGDSANLYCECLNFERLPNRIAREYGDLAVNNIDKGGACALLSMIIDANKNNLTSFASVAEDTDFVQSLFVLISRMKMSLVTPTDVLKASENANVVDDARLVSKLKDIGLIYSEYEKYFGPELYDPRDALTRLASELPEKPFFKNSTVFIDSYYTFTKQEYEIIKHIINQSDNVYVSFTCDDKRDFFAENKKAADQVKSFARGKVKEEIMPDPKRTNSETLKQIERFIWSEKQEKSTNDGALTMISAKNRFDEVEAAASKILEFVRAGNRYRDITVLANNTDTYSNIIDAVFTRAGIPCYLSHKEELLSKPLFSFVFATLSVIIEDFSLRSIKRYIKSGYTDLTEKETDALLNYASSWNLRGRAWYSDSDWTLDPAGYREGEMSDRSVKQLELANKARYKIVQPLIALKETLKTKNLTVSLAIREIYNHLISLGVDEKLRKNAERILNDGDREQSEREIQLWKYLINIINQLDSLCGELKITPKRLQKLISLMCSCYSIGSIPAYTDAVCFGSASLIRAGGSKMVIVLGVCDGEFPTGSVKGGLFNNAEAVALEGAELFITDTLEKQLNTARFFVYSALAAPTEKLVLTMPRSELGGSELRPSTAWYSLLKMFPETKVIDFSERDLLYSVNAIVDNFPSFAEGEIKTKIENLLSKKGIKVQNSFPSVVMADSKIDYKETSLHLSPSKFETYAKCPFSFFGQYVLGLQRKKNNEFSMSEIGNFIHKILDMFMRSCVVEGKFVTPTEEERKLRVKSLSEQYLTSFIGEEAKQDKQFMHIFGNMVKTADFVASNLCDEFSTSKFVPTGFEFKIGLTDNPDIPAIQFDCEGKKVYLRGSIDRVDTYVKDGVTYVRIVDYKTYSRTFSIEMVMQGMETQLLHYLFAYCNKTNSVPVGALYHIVTLPNVQIKGDESPETIKKELEKALTRNGILLNDESILYAMSPDLSYIPVKFVKTYNSLQYKGLCDSEQFKQLEQELKSQVENLAADVFCGKMDVAPKDIEGADSACKYCPLGELCRSKNKKEDDGDEATNTTTD